LSRRRRRALFARTGPSCLVAAASLPGVSALRRGLGRALFGPRLVVLAYHRVNDWPSDASVYTVTTSQFEEQLDCLARALPVVSFAQVLRMRAQPALARDCAVVTLDDGHLDNFTNAARILSARDMTACFFVPTGLLEGDVPASSAAAGPRENRHMSWAQVKALTSMGFEVGAHTRAHTNLLAVPREHAMREVRGSKTALERRLGVPVRCFAYPGGKRGVHYDGWLKRAVAREFSLCCTTMRGRNNIRTMDMHEVRRICVQGWWSLARFRREIEGALDWLGALPHRLQSPFAPRAPRDRWHG